MTDIPVCDYEGSDYQTSFWGRGGREYEDRCEAIALKRLLPKSGNLMLELGAGAGRNTSRYQGFERIVLLDYSRTQLEQAQERLGRSDRYVYVAADVYRLPFVDRLFDAATMIRTLHHMSDAPCALREVRRVLQAGAILILEFANKRNLKAILRYLLRRQDWNPFTLEPIEFAALNFDFHPKAVFDWLKNADFEIEYKLAVSHFRVGLFKRLIPTGLMAGLDDLLQPTGEWWQLTPSVFVRARAIGRNSIPPLERQNAVLSYFKCPDCNHAPLAVKRGGLTCPGCSRRYAIRDGIYEFREPL